VQGDRTGIAATFSALMLVPESSGKSPLLRDLPIMFWSGLRDYGVRPGWVSCNRTGVAVGRVYINVQAFAALAGRVDADSLLPGANS
jgi:hypothetical protein